MDGKLVAAVLAAGLLLALLAVSRSAGGGLLSAPTAAQPALAGEG